MFMEHGHKTSMRTNNTGKEQGGRGDKKKETLSVWLVIRGLGGRAGVGGGAVAKNDHIPMQFICSIVKLIVRSPVGKLV